MKNAMAVASLLNRSKDQEALFFRIAELPDDPQSSHIFSVLEMVIARSSFEDVVSVYRALRLSHPHSINMLVKASEDILRVYPSARNFVFDFGMVIGLFSAGCILEGKFGGENSSDLGYDKVFCPFIVKLLLVPCLLDFEGGFLAEENKKRGALSEAISKYALAANVTRASRRETIRLILQGLRAGMGPDARHHLTNHSFARTIMRELSFKSFGFLNDFSQLELVTNAP